MAQLNVVKFNRIKLQQLKIILRYICGGALMTVIRAGLVGLQVSSDISGQILCSLLIHLCSLIKEHVKFAWSLFFIACGPQGLICGFALYNLFSHFYLLVN